MGWDDIDAGCFSWHTVDYYTSVPSLVVDIQLYAT